MSEFIQLSPTLKYKVLKEGIGEPPQKHQEVYFFFIARDQNGDFSSGSQHTATKTVIGRGWLKEELEQVLAVTPQGQRVLIVTDTGLEYEVEVLRFGGIMNRPWQLEGDEPFERAQSLKQQANEDMKKQAYQDALLSYQAATRLLIGDMGISAKELKKQLHSNLSLAALKLNDFDRCVKEATTVLQDDPYNVKILHRRAVASIHLGEFDTATEDIQRALCYDPESKELQKELENINQQRKKVKNKQSAVYKKMLFGE